MLITLFIYVAVTSFSAAVSQQDDPSKSSDDFVPCEAGWYYFRDKCYRIFGHNTFERFSWEEALEKCRDYHGADLASIQSQEEQDFIVSFLQLQVKSWVWIGLNDHEKESDFKWSDGSVLNYTNWGENQPDKWTGNGNENCVHMMFEPEDNNVGKWNDRACHINEAYACEKNPNPRRRSSNEMRCSSEEGRGWKYEKSCYHVVRNKETWQNAERHCRIYYDGHLVSITDVLQDFFLEHILANMREDVWIGIKMQDQLLQKWSSGWFVSYDGFNKQHIKFRERTCVARKQKNEWITIPCTEQLPFVCEVSKEEVPVLKPAPRGSYCPREFEDWIDFGGEYCYYFEKEKYLTFYEASFDCQRRGGQVVSLHSKEESDVLFPFVKYSVRVIFIGLIRLLEREEQFGWTDGSEFNYENWQYKEPNSLEEKCVEATVHDAANGKIYSWNDIRCERERPYICSVKKISPTEEDGCQSFCIDKPSPLYEMIIQSPDAKPLTCARSN